MMSETSLKMSASGAVKRLRMELDISICDLPNPVLPEGFEWQEWHPLLIRRHAETKWSAFRDDFDGRVFAALRTEDGCRRLMRQIADHPDFCAEATWLITFRPAANCPVVDCASIQGLAGSGRQGAIQNVGVRPCHRGAGLGRALMLKALHGFQQNAVTSVRLEVTEQNETAVRLYRSLGFRVTSVAWRKPDAPTTQGVSVYQSDPLNSTASERSAEESAAS